MPMASRAKKMAWKPKNALPATWNASMRSDIGSADPSPGTQDALGPDDEDDDQQEETSDVLHVTGDDEGGHLHEHADDEAADQGAVGRAQTTEGDPGEHEQQQAEAHVPLDLVGQAEQDAAEGGQGPAHHPDHEDDAVDVDPGGGGQVPVVRDRPHRLADLRALQHQRDQQQHDHRDDDRGQRPVGHGEDPVVDRALALVVGVGVGEPAVDDLDQVAQHQRQADGDDQRRDQPGAPAAQRPPQAPFVQDADAGSGDHRDDRGRDQRDTAADVDVPGDDGPDGDQFAVGEVGQPGGAEDQRETDGADGDEQAEPDAVDQQLDGLDRAAAGVGGAVDEAEEHRLGAAGTDGDGDRVAVAAQVHTGGQVALGEGDLVLAGSGHRDAEPAVLIGVDGLDLPAVGGRDLHLDTLDRPALAGLERAGDRLARGRGDAGYEQGEG